jgi:bifunctional non-homologous end joining protein LigD
VNGPQAGRVPELLPCRARYASNALPSAWVFDLLALEGESTMQLPWSERRRVLEELDLNGPSWRAPDWFDDGEVLFAVVVD